VALVVIGLCAAGLVKAPIRATGRSVVNRLQAGGLVLAAGAVALVVLG